ncbi:MAG TPA: FAD binding domain-containing protein [Solirubrobacteraceae bacterium]|nr:FAD binding domain-containing protein [Solirubrobacteraceae bacterium]
MKPPPFAYHRPDSREAVDRLLADLGGEGKILAGGQSLIPILNMRLSSPAHLIDINGLADEPREPIRDDGVVRFGPLVRHADAEHGAHPLLDAAMEFVGHPAIRSRGTVVGSVAHADPAAEMPAALLALDGEVRCRSARGTRTVPARDFFVGALECCLLPDEWAEEVSIPAAPDGTGYAVEEFARRHGDYAICGVMAAARADSVRLVHFGIASLPIVTDVPADEDVRERVRDALTDVEIADDLHGTERYRRHLAEVLGERAAARAAVRAV